MQYTCCGLITVLLLCVAGVYADLGESQQQPLKAPSKDGTILDADFDEFVEETLEDFLVPGLSIAVIDDGKIESKGYGYAVLPNQNATADTQYFTGSTTKAFTAAALAQLIFRGEHADLKWTSPINEFIRSDFVLEDDYATSHTTIEDALSHRSGLPRHDMSYGRADDTPSSVVQRMRFLPMTAEPRAVWQYCNLMFAVMTDLIETLTGRNLESVLRGNIWKPLGMSSTTFTLPKEDDRTRLARGYYWHPSEDSDLASRGEGDFVPDPYIDLFPLSGAGATISTVNDYALWMKAWLDAAGKEARHNESSPVTKRMARHLLKPRAIMLPDAEDEDLTWLPLPPLYSLGWFTVDIFGETCISHDGGLTGFGTTLYLLPNKNFGVVTMGNTMGTSNTAGAYIASKLLFEKILGESWANSAASHQFREVWKSLPTTHLGPTKIGRKSLHLAPAARDASMPSPFNSIDELAGVYSHPAYGSLNFTVSATSENVSKRHHEILEGGFYDRTWPVKIQLHHLAGTLFATKIYWPHGLGDVRSGKGIVWEDVGESEAVFESGPHDRTVERLGIILEGEMVDAAERKGEKYWREAMIWFEKV